MYCDGALALMGLVDVLLEDYESSGRKVGICPIASGLQLSTFDKAVNCTKIYFNYSQGCSRCMFWDMPKDASASPTSTCTAKIKLAINVSIFA